MFNPIIEKSITVSFKSEGIETDPVSLITSENISCVTYFIGDIVEIETSKAIYSGRISDIEDELLEEAYITLDTSTNFNSSREIIKLKDIKTMQMHNSKENVIIRRRRIKWWDKQ